MAEMYEKEETETTSITTTTTATTNPSSTATAPSEDEMALFLHHILSSPSPSSSPLIPPEKAVKLMSFGSSSSDVALERAGGIIPQSVWDVFCHFKTLQSGLPTPPPPLLPPLPVDLNCRAGTSIAESSAVREFSALIFSGERSASSTVNFPSASTVVDDSDKKENQCITDSGALCSIGPLLERQDSLCLPSSVGSLGSPVRDLISGKRRKPPDINWDDFDCESEEGQEALEDLSKPVASRTSLKRSRAAEVHNLSEKRRRSRINEKMKALQNLIPNSNKTDKASMLDEAIEYLKHLQLQVQMLSMRNGLNLSTMYMPGGLQPMQMSPMHMGFDIENASPEMGMGMLPINQGPSTHPPLMNQIPSSHQPIVSENSFGMDPSPVHFGPTYQLATSAEGICSVGSNILPQHELGMIQLGRNLAAENKTKPVVSSRPLDGQAAMVEGGNCLDACTIVCGENSQQILAGNADTRVLIPYLHDVKTATRIHGDGIEEGARDF